MTKLEERIAELIQAEVDGQLAETDREALNQALKHDPQAQIFMDEMKRVAQLMAEAPELDPPQNLRQRILNSIELPSGSNIMQGPASWFRPASYGLAMAAGVLIAIGVQKVTPDKQPNLSSLVGSMVNRNSDLSHYTSGELKISNDIVKGQISLKSLEKAWVVEFDLESKDRVEISVLLNGTTLSFGGFAHENSSIDHFEVSEGKVRLMNEGNHHFVLFLRNEAKGAVQAQEVGVEVSHDGEIIYRGLL